MRLIPKATRVRTAFFKGFTLADIVIAICMLGIIGLTALSNLNIKWYLAILELTVTALLFPDIDGMRFYRLLFCGFVHLCRKKKYSGGAVAKFIPFTDVKDGYINYGSYYAKVLEIVPLEFRLLSEFKQDSLIETFSFVMKNLNPGGKVQLVKLDRPIIFDEFIAACEAKTARLNGSSAFKAHELESRLKVLAERKRILTDFNSSDKIYMPCYYLVFYGSRKEQLSTYFKSNLDSLISGGIQAKELSTVELAKFLKYNYASQFNEHELDAMPQSSYAKYIMPKEINIRANRIQLDNETVYNYAITDYPLLVGNAWGYQLMDIPNTKVVMNIGYMDKVKAEKMIDRSLMELATKAEKAGKASSQITTQTHLESLQELLMGLKNDNEALVNTSIYLTYFESGAAEIDRQTVKRIVKNEGFKLSDLFFRQAQGCISGNLSMLECIEELKSGINSSSCAACFPFVSNRIVEPSGVPLGENGVPVIIDFFKRDKLHKNSNMVVIGSSGSGKSFATKTLLANLMAENMRVFMYDPENEYTTLAQNLGGKIIDVSSGSASRINPLHILPSGGEEDEGRGGNVLSEHLYFLESFYEVIFPKITPVALEHLNRLTVNVYQKFHIGNGTNTEELALLAPKDFPTFDDLYNEVKGSLTNAKRRKDDFMLESLRELEMYVSKLASGGRFSELWNGATCLATDENFIVFNFQGLLANTNKVLAQAQMLLITRYLNNEIVRNFNRFKHLPYAQIPKFLVVIDEAHVFINKDNPIALTFMKNNSKRVRKYGGMQVVITQSIKDFVSTPEVAAEAKAVITEAQYSLIFPLNSANLDDLLTLYRGLELTEVEQRDIISNETGTAFLISNPNSRTNIHIVANKLIQDMFQNKEAKIMEKDGQAIGDGADECLGTNKERTDEVQLPTQELLNIDLYYDADDGTNGYEADAEFKAVSAEEGK